MEEAKAPEQDAAQPRLTPYERSLDFPPRSMAADDSAVAAWYRGPFAERWREPADDVTARERFLYTRSAEEYVALRRAGEVTCEEFAAAVVRRARSLRGMNQWIYSSYKLFDKLVEAARALDARAASEGVECLAPLYGLPVPMKGTAAIVDFPSGSGSGVLSGYAPVKNSALTELILQRNGLIFGATNVPEFAAAYVTANPASGQTRNPYGPTSLTVGGSSGGSASAVASYCSPLAVTEDTGGSTRVPASSCQNFGFDPSRNHYCNDGNPGMSVTNDQLGLNARSLADIIFFDAALLDTGALHQAASQRAAELPAAGIRIGTPLHPYVDAIVGEGLLDAGTCLSLEPRLRRKYEEVKKACSEAGFTLIEKEWPTAHFDYLGREENVAVEAIFCARKINGKPLGRFPQFQTFTGQMATFVDTYLRAPVSVREIVEDMGSAGAGVHPFGLHGVNEHYDETQLRYFLGPKMKEDLEAYNSYFTATGADVLLLPVSRCATPDLASLADNSSELTSVDGSTSTGGCNKIYMMHCQSFKHLHIPKLVVPTGLTEDGRPTAVQIWGRALSYEQMFDDGAALAHDTDFLHLVARVAAAIQVVPELARVDAPMVRPLLAGIGQASAL